MRTSHLVSVVIFALALCGSVYSQANPNPNDYNYGFISNCQVYTNQTNAAGRYTCNTCMAGYVLTTDATVCYVCAANCNSCNTATGACTQCKVGFSFYNGNCAACPYNCDTCDLVNNKCLTCSNGQNLVNNACISCPANCASCTTSNYCTACNKDFNTVNNGNGTVTCEVNTIKRFLTGTGIFWLGIALLICSLLAILAFCFLSGSSSTPSYDTNAYGRAYSASQQPSAGYVRPQPVVTPMVPVVVTQPQVPVVVTQTQTAPVVVSTTQQTVVRPPPTYQTTTYQTTGYQNAGTFQNPAYGKGYGY